MLAMPQVSARVSASSRRVVARSGSRPRIESGELEHGAGSEERRFEAFVARQRIGEVLLGLVVAAEGRGEAAEEV